MQNTSVNEFRFSEIVKKTLQTKLLHRRVSKFYPQGSGDRRYIILSKLNSFHPDIEFTYEVEEENKPSFLDVLLIRDRNFIETKVYRNPTNNDIYLNWKSFALSI